MHSLGLIVFLLFCFQKSLRADRMSLEDYREKYENRQPGTFPCIYDGSYCISGEEYCWSRTKNCVALFTQTVSEEEKWDKCEKNIESNETEPEVYETCIYFFGLRHQELQKVPKNHTERNMFMSLQMPPLGKELCPFPEKYCQRGHEFCNYTSGSCQLLFPLHVEDTVKRQICEQWLEKNITMVRDACIYYLGLLTVAKPNVENQKTMERTSDGHGMTTLTIVGAVLGIILFITGLVLIPFVILKHKKLLCFKGTQQEPPKVPSRRQTENDIGGPEERRLTSSQDETNLD